MVEPINTNEQSDREFDLTIKLDGPSPGLLERLSIGGMEEGEAAVRITELEAQLGEAYQRVKWADKRAVEAEARAADLARALGKVEAYMASEAGPLYRLWENCDIGDYDDYQTEWEQTLFDLRDWKNGCVPAASVGGGTEWPEVLLYREVLAALNPDKREEGEADNA